jgi:hypothetical protein
MKFFCVTALFLSLVISTSAMAAFGLPEMPDIVKSIPGMGGAPSDSADLDLDSLMDTQTELVGKVSDALLALSTSQTKMAEALGLKEMAAIATANAESLESGGLTGEDDMEKQLSSTMSVNQTIQDKMESGVELDAAGKAKFAESLPFYGKGVYEMVTSAQQASSTAQTVIASKDLMAMNKLGTLLFVAKKSPSLLSGLYQSTDNIIDFAASNGIDTSDLESATDDWE